MAEKMIVYKCPECGADIWFNASDGSVVCRHCNAKYSARQLLSFDTGRMDRRTEKFSWMEYSQNKERVVWSDDEAEKIRTYKCSHCGGEIVGDSNAMSAVCPYCDYPVVVSGTVEGMLRPDYIIPFKKTRENALEIYRRHIRDKSFVPRKFKKLADGEPETVKGIYVPFWLFDCKTSSTASFYSRYRSYYDKDKETWRYIVIKSKMKFNNIPAQASVKMNDELIEAIEPYNNEGLESFNPAYLTGYCAQSYDTELTDCVAGIHKRIEGSVYDLLRSNIDGLSVELEDMDIELEDGNVCYALLPVWIMSVEHGFKTYTFLVNGQTGKVAGRVPVSLLRIVLLLLVVMGLTFSAVLLFMMKFLFII